MSCGIYLNVSPSGKGYIGQAVNIENRWNDFKNFNKLYTSAGKTNISAIDMARNKYNDEKLWKHYILEICEPDELNEKEIFWIDYLGTYRKGYNSTTGGLGCTGHKIEKEKHHFYGKHLSEEHKKKLSESHKGLCPKTCFKKGNIPWNKGIIYSDDIKRKMSESRKGIKSPKAKYYEQYDENMILINTFRTLQECEDAGFKHSSVARCVNDESRMYKGCFWRIKK